MKKFTRQLFCTSLFLAGILFGTNLKAQTPYISITSQACWNNGSLGANAGVVPMIVGASNYSWTVLSPFSATNTSCNTTQTTLTSNNDSTYFNFLCPGIYTIVCDGYNSSNSLIGTLTSTFGVSAPFSISVSYNYPSNTNTVGVCPGSAITITASGALTYTWSSGSMGSMVGFPAMPGLNTMSVIGTSAAGCTAVTAYAGSAFYPPSISVAGPTNGTVCQGSSAILTASGVNSYTWTTLGATTSTVSVIAAFSCQQYTVTGTDANGCIGTMTAYVCADTTCANVWPGDANSDGLVDNTDVLEIGLAYAQTGTARTPGGNSFTSQYASSIGWIGFGSTGKRKVHVDCNGDGTIDMGDTVAIYNNYSLTHAFKPSGTSSNNSDITLVTTNVMEGTWNKADIMLGSSANTISQLYGLVFDLNFDNSMIEQNSAYIIYSPSFLNASNSNVQFRKTNFTNGKVYAASVRTNGSNVTGNGKIGEFWFKVKTGTLGSTLNLSTSNSKKISAGGIKTLLADGSAASTIVAAVGIKENTLQNTTSYFPNPASNQVILKSSLTTSIHYSISDIVGREIKTGTFTTSTTLDVSAFQNGSYLIRLETGSDVTYKKLVIEK